MSVATFCRLWEEEGGGGEGRRREEGGEGERREEGGEGRRRESICSMLYSQKMASNAATAALDKEMIDVWVTESPVSSPPSSILISAPLLLPLLPG